jgi:hypothetical protein
MTSKPWVTVSGYSGVEPPGSALKTNDCGRVYVFEETAGVWKQAAELKGSDTVVGDDFSGSVAISGTTAIVGAPNHAVGGRVYVFRPTAGVWKQVIELKGSDTVAKDGFGGSVAISGTTAVIGARNHDNLAGRAYVFTV